MLVMDFFFFSFILIVLFILTELWAHLEKDF